MKTRLSILILISIFSIFLYEYFEKEKNLDSLWDVVPAKSSLIIELENPYKQLNEILSKTENTSFSMISNTFLNDFNSLFEFLGIEPLEFLQGNRVILSYLNTSNKKLTPVFVTFKKNIDENYLKSSVLNKGFKLDERKLDNEVIFEFKKDNESHVITLLNNILIYSTSSFTLEDFIRSFKDSNQLFKNSNIELFNQVQLKNDLGNIYLNYNDLIKITSTSLPINLNSFINLLPEKSFFDIDIINKTINLNGFSSKNKNLNYSKKYHKDSNINFVPENIVLYSNFSAETLYHKITSNLDTIFSGDISKFYIDGFYKESLDEIFITQTNKTSYFKEKKLVNNEIFSVHDSIILHFFDTSHIDEQIFAFVQQDYIYFSKSFEALQVVNKNTIEKNYWSKDTDFLKFKKEMNESHNQSYILNIKKLLFTNSIDIEYLSIQMSELEDKYYMSVNISQDNSEFQLINDSSLNEYTFNSNLASKPHIIFSHIDNKPEVIIQDENNIIYHLSNSLQPIWSDSIEEIESEIFEIDYYKNNKKQILFSSKNFIYSYDRLGNSLSGFPIKNPSLYPIKNINLIDYDKSKRYRIITYHDNGEIYLLDKNGSTLDGWNPLKMENKLAQYPIHKRVNGKDYFIIILRNGSVYLKNRRGNNYEGFPININTEFSDNNHVIASNNSRKSLIKLLSEEGTLYEVNFNGQIISSKDQYRNVTTPSFILLKEPSDDKSLILSYDDSNLFLEDNKLFLSSTKNLIYQYYELYKDEKFIVITDTIEKKSLFMNSQLKKYYEPISNQNKISILDYGDYLVVYKTLNKTLSMIEIKK